MPRAQKAAKGEKREKKKNSFGGDGKKRNEMVREKKALGGGEGVWERKSGKNT